MPPNAVSGESLDDILARIRKVFNVEFETLDIDGAPLHVLGITNMEKYLDCLIRQKRVADPLRDLPLWAKVWPASFTLGRFLRKFEPQGKTLLEIGAGMGVCGLVAARYGFAKVDITDVESASLDFARANILRNDLSGTARARRLDIRKPPDWAAGYDFIAASEILYLDELHRPVLKFLEDALAPGGKAFFCTDMARAKPRFNKLAARAFAIQEGHIGVKSRDGDGGEQRRVYNILIVERR